MSNLPHRRRLGSIGDSTPASDSSEGTASETCDINGDWTSSNEHNQKQKQNPINTGQQHELYIGSDADCDNVSIGTVLSMEERAQVESFFAGLGTDIFVSSSLANLYEGFGADEWRLIFTGIPVVLYDKGSARSRNVARVTFCLAERGSCFALWRDTINNLSEYKVAGPSFHTMCLSSNHTQTVGFSFDASEAAREIWCHIEKLTSHPENISLNIPSSKKKNKQKRTKQAPLPPKSQISLPCQFHHVTRVIREDAERYYSLQAFLIPATNKHRQ